MGTPIGVREQGLKRAVRLLGGYVEDASELKDAFTRAGLKVVQDATARTPTATGALAGTVRQSRAKASATIRMGTKARNYASFVEWGTGKMAGREPITTAVTQNASHLVQAIERELGALAAKYDLN